MQQLASYFNMFYDEDAPYQDRDDDVHSDTSELSILDEARIEDLEVGDSMMGESTHFKVARGAKEYAVFCERGIKKGRIVKYSAQEVIDFLRDN